MQGCASTSQIPPALLTQVIKCSDQIPDEYRTKLKGVTLEKGATLLDLGKALNSTTATLDRSQGRTGDLISLAEQCDKRNAEILKEAFKRKKFLGIF